MANDNQPIVIKRVKKGGHGHHGGAWKVAFADFAVAMMAFFMLMWLMGATTEEQKAAIGNYFQDPLGTASGIGDGSDAAIDMGGGMNIPSGQGDNEYETFPDEGVDQVSAKAGLDFDDPEALEREARELEKERLDSLREELENLIGNHQALEPFKDQLLLDITSEGLRIQIVDKENRPMFDSGSAVLKDYTRAILREIVKVIDAVPNRISISGHTDQTPFGGGNGYSNWELSADRANAARRELVAGGLEEDKIGRVVGLSSSVLFDTANPYNPINRRISIIVMNKATDDAMAQGAGAGGVPEDGYATDAKNPPAGASDPDATTAVAPAAEPAEATPSP